ncbi:MAG: hypothetical protein OES79_12190 [Planctomycetota bacterium]|nr:hypothetical protein [Planctomycetota bacterium]
MASIYDLKPRFQGLLRPLRMGWGDGKLVSPYRAKSGLMAELRA